VFVSLFCRRDAKVERKEKSIDILIFYNCNDCQKSLAKSQKMAKWPHENWLEIQGKQVGQAGKEGGKTAHKQEAYGSL